MVDGKGLAGTEVIKNNLSEKEIVTTRIFGTKDVYIYEEDIPSFEWKITGDTATILSYPCIRATTSFRGRVYNAWFTPMIPINNGPWKFGNLPGLIIKISDTQDYFIFECEGIELLKKKVPIPKYNWSYISTTRKNVNKLIKNMHESPMQTFISMGKIIRPAVEKRMRTLQIPYNPIELK